jgi:outer membrane protein assembly factor BamB
MLRVKRARLARSLLRRCLLSTGGKADLGHFKCEDEIRGTPFLHQGMLYVGCYDNNLYALNAADGQFQWKYPSDGGIVSRPLGYENNVFFCSEDQRLHVVSARTGKLVWTYFTEGKIYSSPRISDGHIFFGSEDQRFARGQRQQRQAHLEVHHGWSYPFHAIARK